MTTKHSPRRVLKAQASKVATLLKSAEQGKKITSDPGRKIADARSKESVTFAVVMDDKVLKIEMTWEAIRKTSKKGIAEYIFNQMREARDTLQ